MLTSDSCNNTTKTCISCYWYAMLPAMFLRTWSCEPHFLIIEISLALLLSRLIHIGEKNCRKQVLSTNLLNANILLKKQVKIYPILLYSILFCVGVVGNHNNFWGYRKGEEYSFVRSSSSKKSQAMTKRMGYNGFKGY